MDNNHPEVISVQIGDKEYNLKLGPAAFRLAQVRHKIIFTQQDLANPSIATLAQLAYVGVLPDNPKWKEEDFLVDMANSNEGDILAAVGKSLERMTEGLSGLSASGDEGNAEGKG